MTLALLRAHFGHRVGLWLQVAILRAFLDVP